MPVARSGATTSAGRVPSTPAISANRPTPSIPRSGQGVHFPGAVDVGVGVAPSLLGDDRGVESGHGAQPGRQGRDQLLAGLVDRLGADHQAREVEVAAVPAAQLVDHRMVLVHEGRVLQGRVAELPAHHRTVVQLPGVEQGGKGKPEAASVHEHVLERPLGLKIGHDADSGKVAPGRRGGRKLLDLVGLGVQGGLGQPGGQPEGTPAQGAVDVLPGGAGGGGELDDQVVGDPQRGQRGGGAAEVDQRLLGPGQEPGADDRGTSQHVGLPMPLGPCRADEAGKDASPARALGPGLDRVEHLHDPGRLARRDPGNPHVGQGGVGHDPPGLAGRDGQHAGRERGPLAQRHLSHLVHQPGQRHASIVASGWDRELPDAEPAGQGGGGRVPSASTWASRRD